MRVILNRFRWLGKPQLCALFVVLCLSVGAYGSSMQRSHQSIVTPKADIQQVKGAEITTVPEPIRPDCSVTPCMALTFDDGPNPRTTPQILDILSRNQVRATFFMVGREVPGREPIVRRVYQEGHEIGNHTWNHPDLVTVPTSIIRQEVSSTQAAISAAGVPAPRVFRPPYGSVNEAVRTHIPLPVARWDIDTEDWLTRDPGRVGQHLLNDAHPGGIILMHDTQDSTIQALEPALQALKQHYQFVTVSELLQLSPGDRGEYFNSLP